MSLAPRVVEGVVIAACLLTGLCEVLDYREGKETLEAEDGAKMKAVAFLVTPVFIGHSRDDHVVLVGNGDG